MNGWIIYDEFGARRNQWFIRAFEESAKVHGIELILKILGEEDILLSPLPDFAIVRTIRPELNQRLEELGVRTFNNSKTSRIANNKWFTYKFCGDLKIPVMNTALLSEKTLDMDFPLVLKSLDGHGGSEVFLIKSERELLGIDRERFLVQEFCSTPGKDMRVYVLGGKIISGVLRTSDTDFRSNFSLGGSVSVGEVSSKQEEIIRLIHKELEFDFVGVDFISHNGEWVLNEIEDVVGTRMLYRCTDIDIVNLYMDHVAKCLAGN